MPIFRFFIMASDFGAKLPFSMTSVQRTCKTNNFPTLTKGEKKRKEKAL